jgi:hypothetical protein
MTVGQTTRYRDPPARRRARAALAGVTVASALGAMPSAALSDDREIHLDPGSPVGREYVIPLDEARDVGRVTTPGRAGAAVFGAGIRRGAPGAATRPPDGPVRGPGHGGSAGKPRTAGAASRSATVEAGGPPALAFTGGAAAVVLLLGGAGLAVVRRLARRA